jgi:hypothetical protein
MAYMFLTQHTDATSSKELSALTKYLHRMRANPLFAVAEFVFIVEANHCWVRAKEICLWVSGAFAPCISIGDAPKKHPQRPGVWISDGDKERFVVYANQFLRGDTVHVYHDFISCSMHPEQAIGLLQAQLSHYRRKLKPTADAAITDHRSYVWSGKDKGGGQKDDMAIAFMQGLWHAACFMANPRMTYPYQPKVMQGINPDLKHYSKCTMAGMMASTS